MLRFFLLFALASEFATRELLISLLCFTRIRLGCWFVAVINNLLIVSIINFISANA
jgi:hypothetical protein